MKNICDDAVISRLRDNAIEDVRGFKQTHETFRIDAMTDAKVGPPGKVALENALRLGYAAIRAMRSAEKWAQAETLARHRAETEKVASDLINGL